MTQSRLDLLQDTLSRLTAFCGGFERGEEMDFAPIVDEVTEILDVFKGTAPSLEEKAVFDAICERLTFLTQNATKEMARLKSEMRAHANLATGLKAYSSQKH
ncbi:MAG: hypothetical protein C0514_03855 [Candidatus Puniceispirillum sp.]|nr:hypothetical protein [Candidatus Puniceispirillum sp.]